jgi:hypothetical protein
MSVPRPNNLLDGKPTDSASKSESLNRPYIRQPEPVPIWLDMARPAGIGNGLGVESIGWLSFAQWRVHAQVTRCLAGRNSSRHCHLSRHRELQFGGAIAQAGVIPRTVEIKLANICGWHL